MQIILKFQTGISGNLYINLLSLLWRKFDINYIESNRNYHPFRCLLMFCDNYDSTADSNRYL